MEEKKEIQLTIINNIAKATEEEFLNILKLVAPGTNLRIAIDGIIKIGKGALIVIENEHLFPLLDGGFYLGCRFTPQRVMELSKMDGAIILSKDIKRINYANVTLMPDSRIKTNETGTRHKAAERTAKQIGGLAIAISERRKEVSLFYKNIKYNLKDIEDILQKANSNLQILEKQRELFDEYIRKLNKSEFKGVPSLHLAVNTIQKGRIMQKIFNELKKTIIEAGNEGILQKLRLKEILTGIERETNLIIKDYSKIGYKRSKTLIDSLTYEELTEEKKLERALGYEEESEIILKGWRILSKTSLTEAEIAMLIKEIGTLKKILEVGSIHELLLGEERALQFKKEIEKIRTDNF